MGLTGRWVDAVREHKPMKKLILDMDSSVSPTHGDQEGTAYSGHFGCDGYHRCSCSIRMVTSSPRS